MMAPAKKQNLVEVFVENGYSKFTTTFTINHGIGDKSYPRVTFGEVFEAWAPVLKKALEARMESCISMLFRNKNNVISATEHSIVFKKNNGMIHRFNHSSFKLMEESIEHLDNKNWYYFIENPAVCSQILKALYWISEEDRKDRNNISFGNLISCLHEFIICRPMVFESDK